jgi:hypothetical protein
MFFGIGNRIPPLWSESTEFFKQLEALRARESQPEWQCVSARFPVARLEDRMIKRLDEWQRAEAAHWYGGA